MIFNNLEAVFIQYLTCSELYSRCYYIGNCFSSSVKILKHCQGECVVFWKRPNFYCYLCNYTESPLGAGKDMVQIIAHGCFGRFRTSFNDSSISKNYLKGFYIVPGCAVFNGPVSA
ncbi:hypothetical protein ES703_83946 [subsurface metagenome]